MSEQNKPTVWRWLENAQIYVKEKIMFNFKSLHLTRLSPVLSVLLVTVVSLAQSETGNVLLAALQIVVQAQPHGF